MQKISGFDKFNGLKAKALISLCAQARVCVYGGRNVMRFILCMSTTDWIPAPSPLPPPPPQLPPEAAPTLYTFKKN